MICAIMQPHFLPYPGYFGLMDKADYFVYLDNVQLEKQSWQTRNRIPGESGEQWLTVEKQADSKTLIKDVKLINKERWTKKLLKTIKQNYSKAEHYEEVYPVLEQLITNGGEFLGDYNITITNGLANMLGIKTHLKKASRLGKFGDKTENILGICKKLGCKTYLSVEGSKDYLEEDKFKDISLEYYTYNGEKWSIVDYLMHNGFTKKQLGNSDERMERRQSEHKPERKATEG